MGRVHAGAVHGLHLEWRVAMKPIEFLDWRLMMRIISCVAVVPSATVIVEMILMMVLLVVHCQLAHVDMRTVKSIPCIRASKAVRVFRSNADNPELSAGHLSYGVAVPGWRGRR